jgi:hypothetical protein
MRRRGAFYYALLVGLLVGTFIVTSTGAEDKDAKYFENQFSRWSKVIADLKEADVTDQTGQDIEIIRTWIGKAQALLASDKLDEIESILKRIEAQATYIRAKINRLAAEDSAEEAEALAKSAEEQALKAKATAEDAERKMKALESQGL